VVANLIIGGGNVAIGGGNAAPKPVPTPVPAPATDDADAAAKAAAPPAPANALPPAAAVVSFGQRQQFTQAGVDQAEHVRKQRAIYDAEVHYFDRHLRKVLDLLEAKGLSGSTCVSFNADHGEEFMDHGGMGHGQSVYAELDHVPWILRAPWLPAGRVVTDSVMNLDLAPTLLGLCGAEIPATFQGRNLADVLASGDEVPPAPIFTERWGGGIGGFGGGGPQAAGGDDVFIGQWAVIEGSWKTVVTRSIEPNVGPDGKPLLGPDGNALPPRLKVDLGIFDLLTDMKDAHSLLETERPRAEAAAKRLETWLREMKKLNGRYASEDTTSDNAAAALRALGYAQ
jgi:arylsulfatase A-like enzyme